MEDSLRALTVIPGVADSMAVVQVPEPVPRADDLVVDGLSVGICGTDREIAAAEYGTPPPGRQRLVLGHESLGRVRQAPEGSGFAPGDLVVGVVRRPDPVPCGACAHGHFDMCRNGGYTERGIKELDGYASEAWCVEAGYAVGLDPSLEPVGTLLEPTSVVAKAWDQIERIGSRSWFEPERVLVTGAGPIGLLAALLGRQRGLDVHVLDVVREGRKPDLVEALGATYHCDGYAAVVAGIGPPDVVVEATGVPSLVLDAVGTTQHYGIVCLTGISSAGRTVHLDAGDLNRTLVLENDVVVGSVNANLDHYAQAAQALAAADLPWLERLITRRLPLGSYRAAFRHEDDDIKVVLDLTA
jgi:glucose 1-dehydrogenase